MKIKTKFQKNIKINNIWINKVMTIEGNNREIWTKNINNKCLNNLWIDKCIQWIWCNNNNNNNKCQWWDLIHKYNLYNNILFIKIITIIMIWTIIMKWMEALKKVVVVNFNKNLNIKIGKNASTMTIIIKM